MSQRKNEPIPAAIDNSKRIGFWLLFVVFFVVYGLLINKAIKDNQSYKKPATLGMVQVTLR